MTQPRTPAAILVVDDSLTIRMDLAATFASAGYATELCADLACARAALERSAFALIVLDVNLPDGDGIDFLLELKRSSDRRGIPVMLLSSAAEVKDRIRGLHVGADDYVGKPYDNNYLLSRARELTRPFSVGNGGAKGVNGAGEANGAADARFTVLLIDDSATFREALAPVLRGAGYDVCTAASGEEGLRLAVDLRPHAILVDGNLPGIDGGTVIRRLKLDEALRRTPCILLTASEERGDELRGLDAGADAFVRKDGNPAPILARLGAVLRSTTLGGVCAPVQNQPTHLGAKQILAVDDSRTYLHELGAQLRLEGYEPILAHSGEEALELLAAKPVDCILLDLRMPGISGEETCSRIKSTPCWREIPLIMLTSLDESEAMVAGINSGADDYITKSGDFEVLKARLRAQLRRKQYEDENRRIREQLLRKEVEAAEARAARELAETRAALLADLECKNKELEAFSYSVSHDLRSPLRAINGFAQALSEDYAQLLPEEGRNHLERVRAAARRMGELIDDLLALSRVTRHELRCESVDLSALALEICGQLRSGARERDVDMAIAPGLMAPGDAPLIRAALENLLGNAWKYTGKRARAKIEFGACECNGARAYFVRDDGAGFDMAYAGKLFGAFQRLHSASDFPGTGVGLATVQRIVDRHGGRIWADAVVNGGACFYFTLPERARPATSIRGKP